MLPSLLNRAPDPPMLYEWPLQPAQIVLYTVGIDLSAQIQRSKLRVQLKHAQALSDKGSHQYCLRCLPEDLISISLGNHL